MNWKSRGQRRPRIRIWATAAATAVGLGSGLLVSTAPAQAATQPSLIATPTVTTTPTAVAVDPNTYDAIVVNGPDLASITETQRSDTKNGQMPTGFVGQALALDPKNGLVFVRGTSDGGLEPRLEVAGESNLGMNDNVNDCASTPSIAVDSTTGNVYETCDDNIWEFNESALPNNPYSAQLARTAVAVPGRPISLAVDPNTGTVYAALQPTSGAPDVVAISEATNTVTATIPVGTNTVGGLDVDASTGTVYVAHDNNSVSVISESSNTVTNTVSGLTGAVAVATDPVSKNVFVTDGASSVAVIDEQTAKVTTTLTSNTAGASTSSVGVNSATGMAYVANWGNNTVAMID